MSDIFNFADTWNNVGTSFRGIGLNVTNGSGDTPVYAAGSRVLRFTKDGAETSSIGIDSELFQTPTQTSQAVWVLDPALTDTDGTKYGALWGVSDQNAPDPRANTLYNIGYNPARFFSTSEPALSLSWESYYVPPGNDPAMEWHLAFNSDDGLVSSRMMSVIVPRDGVSTAPRPQLSFSADILRLYDFLGNQKIHYEFFGSSVEIFHEDTTGYIFAINNTPVHYQRDAANSAYLPLPYYGSVDQLILKRYTEVSTERSVGDAPTQSMMFFDAGSFMVANGYLFRGRWTNAVTGNVNLVDLRGQATGDVTTFLSNTGAGRTVLYLYSGGGTTGDVVQTWHRESGGSWSAGVDASDSFAYVLSPGTALGSNNRLRIDANTVGFPTLPPKITPVAVGSLPSAATVGAGTRHHVTDAFTPAFGATVAAGGAVSTPVYSDGTNWKVG